MNEVNDFSKCGVMFGAYHTARDYGLILTARPDTGSPKPKTYSQDIPGADGVLDLTEATTGEVKYSNRTVTVKAKRILPLDQQETFKSQIMGDLHGRKVQVILDEDPERYYYGRVTVTFPRKTADQLYVTFTVDAQPYKRARDVTEITATLSTLSEARDVPWQGVTNSSTMSHNADFVLTNGGDMSLYTAVVIRYPQNITSIGSPTIYVTSGSSSEGNVHTYSRRITQAEIDARRVAVPIATLTAGGVDVTDIRRVLSSGMGSSDAGKVRLCVSSVYGSILINNGAMGVVPTIISSADNIHISYNGRGYDLSEGENIIDDLLLTSGENRMHVTSPGDVTITLKFRKGWL